MAYDASGRLATLKHLGGSAQFSYGEHGLVAIDAEDGGSRYGFDDRGRLVSATDGRRRMAPLQGETPDPAPFGHDKPSNSLFLPAEYRSVNCRLCTSVVESLRVTIGQPVYVDEATNITVKASGVCYETFDGPEISPFDSSPRSFSFIVSFGDGQTARSTPTTPRFRTSHVYRHPGPHRLTATVRCSCASALFSFLTASVDFDVLCRTPSTSVPRAVSGVTYNRRTRSTSPDGWGFFGASRLAVDIAAYYDKGSDSWRPKVTSASSREYIYVGYPSHIREASVAAATKRNCRQMIADLSRTSEDDIPRRWAMLAAVRAHEEGHSREWRQSLDRAFPNAKATIEGLSVPHVCKMTAAQARTRIKALGAYGKAVDAANMAARNHYREIYANYALQAEQAVTAPVVRGVRAKAEDDWPSACQ